MSASPLDNLRRIGYSDDCIERVRILSDGHFSVPDDVARIVDKYDYNNDWQDNYFVASVAEILRKDTIMCVEGMVLSYGLLESMPEYQRAIVSLYRKDCADFECGHVVTAYWCDPTKMGAISKSNYPVLSSIRPSLSSLTQVALHYARQYQSMGMTPLYFGLTTLDEVSEGLDWRFSSTNLAAIPQRIGERFEYAFTVSARDINNGAKSS